MFSIAVHETGLVWSFHEQVISMWKKPRSSSK